MFSGVCRGWVGEGYRVALIKWLVKVENISFTSRCNYIRLGCLGLHSLSFSRLAVLCHLWRWQQKAIRVM